jgi:hypothetical protein
MIGQAPICMNCLHFDADNKFKLTCRAFPQGIPDKIILNEADHRLPFAGDHDLRYDPIDPDYELPEALTDHSD